MIHAPADEDVVVGEGDGVVVAAVVRDAFFLLSAGEADVSVDGRPKRDDHRLDDRRVDLATDRVRAVDVADAVVVMASAKYVLGGM